MFNGFSPQAFGLHGWSGVSIIYQTLRPDTDDSISDWTDQVDGTTNIYNSIGEASASDTNYIKTPTPPSGTVARFRMSDPTAGMTLGDPVSVKYRFKKTNSDDQKLTVSLKQDTTLIKSWTHAGVGLTESFQTVTQTLSSGEFAAITNFKNLFIEFKAEPNVDTDTVLLLHMDTNFNDTSGKPAPTIYGSTQITTSTPKFGAGCGLFNGSTDWLTFPSSADYEFGSGSFTIDWWENRTSTINDRTVVARDSSGKPPWCCGYSYTSGVSFFATSDGVNWDIAYLKIFGPMAGSVWNHFAAVRSGNTFYLFKNGVMGDTWTSSLAIYPNSNPLSIGNAFSGLFYPGQIDELRISKGIARWTANFTPPNAPY